MITNQEISELLISALSNSTAINDYSTAKWNKNPLIMLGIDIEKPPFDTDYPLFAIAPMVNQMSDNNTNFDYEIVVHVFIKGADEPTINGNIVRYTGIYEVEDIGNIAVQELKDAFCNTNLEAYDITFYNHEITLFPIYTGAIVINFSVPNVIGTTKLSMN